MKAIMLAVVIAMLAGVGASAANFPYIRLNNQTNRISDNGTALTRDGVAIGGGSSPFTNIAGVVQYAPGQTATNVFNIVSGLADNATNVALAVDTANPWTSSGRLLTLSSGGVTNFVIRHDGGLWIGPNAWQDVGLDDSKLWVPNVISMVDSNEPIWIVAQHIVLDSENYNYFANFSWGVHGDKDSPTTQVSLDSKNTNGVRHRIDFVTDPVNSLGYDFALRSQVTGATKFQLNWDGSITTGGNTNRWIFADWPNINVDNTPHVIGGFVTNAIDAIWTNRAGVVQYAPGQAATNVFNIVSGLADNATNVAMEIDTVAPWTDVNASFLALKNNGTNIYRFTPKGETYIGRYIADGLDVMGVGSLVIWNDARDPQGRDTTIALGTGWGDSFTNYTTGNLAFSPTQTGEDATAHLYFEQAYDSIINTMFLGVGGFSTGSHRDTYFQFRMTTNDVIVTKLSPFAPDGEDANLLGTALDFPTGNLLAVHRHGTNKFTVVSNGSITTGGNTNRWILKGLTVDGGTTNAHWTINGTNFFSPMTPE